VGISLEFYSRIERGQTLPIVPTLVKVAGALGTSTDALLGGGRGAPASRVSRQLRDAEPARLRLLLRRLRRVKPRTLRLLSLLAKELEK
jgi:transcriptional regulator with XRE-family HTH domain